jgi:hypothetical protein
MRILFSFLIWYGLFQLCVFAGQRSSIMLLFLAIGLSFGIVVMPGLIAEYTKDE